MSGAVSSGVGSSTSGLGSVGGLFGTLHYTTEDGSLTLILGGTADIGPGKITKLTLSQIKNIGKYKSQTGKNR